MGFMVPCTHTCVSKCENKQELLVCCVVYRVMLADFVKLGETEHGVPELQFEQLPFNHPLFLMYSSGTTGIPKCMVHSAGVSDITTLILHACNSKDK